MMFFLLYIHQKMWLILISLIVIMLLTRRTRRPGSYAIICSVPYDKKRISHMKQFMKAANLNSYSFTWEKGLFVSKLTHEVQRVVQNRMHHDFNEHNIDLYVAHCLTYLKVLRWFVKTDIQQLFVFEDDVVFVDKACDLLEVVRSAPKFDVLLLEWCYGQCQNEYPNDSDSRWVYGLNAHCTAAVVWTRTAASKFLSFVERRKRLFNIDELTAEFFSTNQCVCVYAKPPILKQDRETFTGGMSGDNGLALCF